MSLLFVDLGLSEILLFLPLSCDDGVVKLGEHTVEFANGVIKLEHFLVLDCHVLLIQHRQCANDIALLDLFVPLRLLMLLIQSLYELLVMLLQLSCQLTWHADY